MYDGIKAVARLLSIYPYITYTIIGDGKQYHMLQKYIQRLGLQKNIRLVGWQPHEKVIQALYDADIYLHPSLSCEGIPNAIMEAMATGLPVVATDVNGTPELVRHRKTGYVVPAGSIKSLVHALKTLIKDPSLRLLYGSNGRIRVTKQHNIARENKKLMKMFKALLRVN